jgi:hypothetical protein
MVLTAVIIGVCLLLLVLGFLLPRLSLKPQGELDSELEAGRRKSRKAPGFLGDMLSGSFRGSRKAADKSASTGRRARRKLPF